MFARLGGELAWQVVDRHDERAIAREEIPLLRVMHVPQEGGFSGGRRPHSRFDSAVDVAADVRDDLESRLAVTPELLHLVEADGARMLRCPERSVDQHGELWEPTFKAVLEDGRSYLLAYDSSLADGQNVKINVSDSEIAKVVKNYG